MFEWKQSNDLFLCLPDLNDNLITRSLVITFHNKDINL